MRVALRVEVRSRRGLREGVPNLMRLFNQHQVRASFFFPLGRDFAGRSPLATWRERRALGLAALTYGTLSIAPSLREQSSRLIGIARANGHEAGLFGLSPLPWARRLAHADGDWVRQQMARLWQAYQSADDAEPVPLAVPGWQLNPGLLKEVAAARIAYTSATRGRFPYFPVYQGVRGRVPEIPTTLPTVDEALARPGVSLDNVHEYLYAESRYLLPGGHVFAVAAEHEGLARIDLMERLLVMWKGQDGAVRALGDVLRDLDPAGLPHHQVGWDLPEGAVCHQATQSVQVPA